MYPRNFSTLALCAGVSAFCSSTLATAADGKGPSPSRALNPAIGVNGMLLSWWATADHDPAEAAEPPHSDHGHAMDDPGAGAKLQAVEIRLTSSIDAYAKADLILGIHGESVAVEEAVVSLLDPPAAIGLRGGLFRLPLGKSSPLHAHQQPFVERSLAVTELVGEEGLADVGVELSWLTPLPWFSEFTATLTGGGVEPFGSERRSDLLYGARWRNLWDLADTTTLDLGLSGVHGWSKSGDGTTLAAADLSFRWRPLQGGRERSALWRNEVLVRRGIGEPVAGAYSLARWQVSKRWFLQGRYDRFGFEAHGHEEEEEHGLEEEEEHGPEAPEERWRASAALAYVPSEFQTLRLQGSHTESVEHSDEADDRIMLQYIFSLGPHPAHLYW